MYLKRIMVTILLLMLCIFCFYLNFELSNNNPYEIQISDSDLEYDDVDYDSAYAVSRTDIEEYREEKGVITFDKSNYAHIRLEKKSGYKICVKQGDIVYENLTYSEK